MNCDDYLAMLETLPVGELTHGDARDHAAICHDCNRVTRVVAERERNMLMAYGDVLPSASAIAVADAAVLMGRRRHTLRRLSIGLAAAGVVAIVAVVNDDVFRHRQAPIPDAVQQVFAIRCSSARAAAGQVAAALGDRLQTKIVARDPEGLLIVEASPVDLEKARDVIGRLEDQCAWRIDAVRKAGAAAVVAVPARR